MAVLGFVLPQVPAFNSVVGVEQAQAQTTKKKKRKFDADALAALGLPVERGQFGADMSVALTNDGPVTIWLDTEDR